MNFPYLGASAISRRILLVTCIHPDGDILRIANYEFSIYAQSEGIALRTYPNNIRRNTSQPNDIRPYRQRNLYPRDPPGMAP